MANLYKKILTKTDKKTGQKKSVETRRWYGRYVDAAGVERRVVLSTDKKISQRMLDELVLAAEQGRFGDPIVEAAKVPIQQHLTDYENHLTAKNNTKAHIQLTLQRVNLYLETMQIQEITKLKSASVETFLAKLRKENAVSLETCNHYIQAIKSFCSWLVKNDRLAKNPLVSLSKFNAAADRRHLRRALDSDEFRRLWEAAESGKQVEGISGADRAMFYILAAWTGFRKGELGSITIKSFNLDTEYPTLTIAAAYSKRRREDVQYLHPDVVSRLRTWLAVKKPKAAELLFPVTARTSGFERKTSEMMKRDLEIARKKWVAEAETPDEKERREQSDFLKYVDTSGRFADFHGLRHTFITNLCRSNVSPKTAQTLARHSDISLTMNIYSHVSPEEQAAAINAMPGLGKIE